MNILMITENDPAGMGIAFTNAINRYTEYHCRLITTETKYNFHFKKDLHVPDLDDGGFEEIRQLLRDADILHFHILADESIELGPIRVKDFVGGKTLLHHHHGHPVFRARPEEYRKKYSGLKRRVLVSTPDLLKLLPEAIWQPNLVPINHPLLLPELTPVNGHVLIGQSVTRKALKNTEDLLSVIKDMKRNCHIPRIDLDIIENTDHRECLRRKNRCHIIFDHMQGYFGVSSLESLSQGKAVIAGLDEWNLRHIEEYAGTSSIPWIICRSKEELTKTIIDLYGDKERIGEIGRRSRTFMCQHWSDEKATETLADLYEKL
jgi:glycosyltransferase involved in cell wall biosynthesis